MNESVGKMGKLGNGETRIYEVAHKKEGIVKNVMFKTILQFDIYDRNNWGKDVWAGEKGWIHGKKSGIVVNIQCAIVNMQCAVVICRPK